MDWSSDQLSQKIVDGFNNNNNILYVALFNLNWSNSLYIQNIIKARSKLI